MRILERIGRFMVALGVFGLASYFALHFGWGGLWTGLEARQSMLLRIDRAGEPMIVAIGKP